VQRSEYNVGYKSACRLASQILCMRNWFVDERETGCAVVLSVTLLMLMSLCLSLSLTVYRSLSLCFSLCCARPQPSRCGLPLSTRVVVMVVIMALISYQLLGVMMGPCVICLSGHLASLSAGRSVSIRDVAIVRLLTILWPRNIELCNTVLS